MKKETKKWLEHFKGVHYLKNDEEALAKLVDIHKTYIIKVRKSYQGNPIKDYEIEGESNLMWWTVIVRKNGNAITVRLPRFVEDLFCIGNEDIIKICWDGMILKKGKPKKQKEMRANIDPRLRLQILARDNFRCRFCGRTPRDCLRLEVDHMTPIFLGGTDNKNNLQTLCYECHKGKTITEKKENREKLRYLKKQKEQTMLKGGSD